MDADPADVPGLSVVEIQPAEAQAVLRGIELGDLLAVHDAEGLALGPSLMRAARLRSTPASRCEARFLRSSSRPYSIETYSCSRPISAVDNHAPFFR